MNSRLNQVISILGIFSSKRAYISVASGWNNGGTGATTINSIGGNDMLPSTMTSSSVRIHREGETMNISFEQSLISALRDAPFSIQVCVGGSCRPDKPLLLSTPQYISN